jgi:integrase/recombinase XerD
MEMPAAAYAYMTKQSRRQRVVPLDFLVVQAFDGYELERMGVPGAGDGDFVLVNLFPRGRALRGFHAGVPGRARAARSR